MTIFFPDANNKQMAQITQEFHVVKDLACNVIFGNDIIAPEIFLIYVAQKTAVIHSCKNLFYQLQVSPHKKVVNHTVCCATAMVIPPRSTCLLSIRFTSLKIKQDYILLPTSNNAHLPGGMYVIRSVISGDQNSVLVTNVTDDALTIPKRARIGTVESLNNAQDIRLWESAT